PARGEDEAAEPGAEGVRGVERGVIAGGAEGAGATGDLHEAQLEGEDEAGDGDAHEEEGDPGGDRAVGSPRKGGERAARGDRGADEGAQHGPVDEPAGDDRAEHATGAVDE